jgi:hypothetical protein
MQGRVAKSGPALWVVGPPARSAGSHGCQKRQISHGLVGRQAGRARIRRRARAFSFLLVVRFPHTWRRTSEDANARRTASAYPRVGPEKKKAPGWQYFAAARSPSHPPAEQSPTSTGAELGMVLTHATVH